MEERNPRPGEIYRHFKNRLYQIITIAIHSETGEKMVVYQALYGDFKMYVRPLPMFVREVDRKKYPQIRQKYCFEPVTLTVQENNEITEYTELQDNTENTFAGRATPGEQVFLPLSEEGTVNPILLDFLDADTYEEKLDLLLNKKKYLNDKLINDMAASLDCTINEGDLEQKTRELIFCLQTHARFESRRLR